MKIFPIIRKIIETVGGAGFIASVIQVGLRFSNRFTLIASQPKAGIAIEQSPTTFRGPEQTLGVNTSLLGVTGTLGLQEVNPAIATTASLREATGTQQTPAVTVATSLREASGTQQKPGIATNLLGVTGTMGNEIHTPGIAIGTRISEFHLDTKPAYQIVRVVYNLNKRAGANAQSAVGTAWTNPGNATGINDGLVATAAGAALASTHGIELAYADSVGKGELAITSATLFVYANVTGDGTGLLSTTTISYNIGAGLVTLEVINGNFSNLVTPRSYSLTLLDTWAEYDALVARVVNAKAAASVGVTARLDAIEIEIIATKTDTL